MDEKKKISELDLKPVDKLILQVCYDKGLPIAFICAKTGYGYSTIGHKVSILEALGFIEKHKSLGNKTFYQTNRRVLDL